MAAAERKKEKVEANLTNIASHTHIHGESKHIEARVKSLSFAMRSSRQPHEHKENRKIFQFDFFHALCTESLIIALNKRIEERYDM